MKQRKSEIQFKTHTLLVFNIQPPTPLFSVYHNKLLETRDKKILISTANLKSLLKIKLDIVLQEEEYETKNC